MIKVSRRVDASPTQVWQVLADGWSYAGWVVGASRVRAVEERWPQPGTRIHHSVGVWPAVLSDDTVVEKSDPGRRLVMTARGWPIGEAVIDLRVTADGDGSMVEMFEDASKGPGRVVPAKVRQAVIGVRNKETLRRLAYLAERRPHPDAGDSPAAGSRESFARSHAEEV